ncbi:MAG TPA: hypothetical protein PKV75_07270, partial [Desulfobacterales bacterium]|nr:hypothetical protein [Desulfobacterales bacterium]
LEKAEEVWVASIHFNLDINRTEKALILKLYDILRRHPGSCPAYIHLVNPEKTETIVSLPETMKLQAGSSLIREVNGLFGYKVVETICSEATSSSNSNTLRENKRKGRFEYA